MRVLLVVCVPFRLKVFGTYLVVQNQHLESSWSLICCCDFERLPVRDSLVSTLLGGGGVPLHMAQSHYLFVAVK